MLYVTESTPIERNVLHRLGRVQAGVPADVSVKGRPEIPLSSGYQEPIQILGILPPLESWGTRL